MKGLVTFLVALTLAVSPIDAQVWISAEVGASLHPGGSLVVDIPHFHVSCRTSIHLCLDLGLGIAWGSGKVYDVLDADLNYDALLHLDERTTVVPRIGFSFVTINDATLQNGINAGIGFRRGGIEGSPDNFLRVDALYRRVSGHNWSSLAVGVEWRVGKHPAPAPQSGATSPLYLAAWESTTVRSAGEQPSTPPRRRGGAGTMSGLWKMGGQSASSAEGARHPIQWQAVDWRPITRGEGDEHPEEAHSSPHLHASVGRLGAEYQPGPEQVAGISRSLLLGDRGGSSSTSFARTTRSAASRAPAHSGARPGRDSTTESLR